MDHHDAVVTEHLDMSTGDSIMAHNNRSKAGVVLAALAAGACSDLGPTSPTFRADGSPAARARLIPTGRTSRYGCMASERDPLHPGRYRYSRIALHVPEGAATEGDYLRYVYRAGSGVGQPDAAATCLIPNRPEAVAFMDRHLARDKGMRVAGTPSQASVPDGSRQDAPVGGYRLPSVYVYAHYTYTFAGVYRPTGGCVNYANCYDMSVSDGGGGESWDAGEPEIIEDRPATIPDCTVAQKDGTVSAAYCDAILPNEEQSNRIAAVLTKMRAKGGECANIALFAEIIMDAQQFRMFDPQRYTGFAAAALGDGAGGIVMSTDFTTRYYDADHHSGEEPPRNLSTEIAHEVDHLLGRHHDPSLGTNARPQTANMYACSDLTP